MHTHCTQCVCVCVCDGGEVCQSSRIWHDGSELFRLLSESILCLMPGVSARFNASSILVVHGAWGGVGGEGTDDRVFRETLPQTSGSKERADPSLLCWEYS